MWDTCEVAARVIRTALVAAMLFFAGCGGGSGGGSSPAASGGASTPPPSSSPLPPPSPVDPPTSAPEPTTPVPTPTPEPSPTPPAPSQPPTPDPSPPTNPPPQTPPPSEPPDPAEPTPVPSLHRVGGTVSGLAGSGLTLVLNGVEALDRASDGAFAFDYQLAVGATYHVDVATHPFSPRQTCQVANGSGTIDGAALNVRVTCTTNSYSVGGAIVGLEGSGLVLSNAGQPVAIDSAGRFEFTALSGSSYNVTVDTQPTNPSQTCEVMSGSGQVGGADFTAISVQCTRNRYRIDVRVSGLEGTSLTLEQNGETIQIVSNGTRSFPSLAESGRTYAITVTSQPLAPSQTCTVSNATGTITGANLQIDVVCEINTYHLRGVVSGLVGTGLNLRLNGAHDLQISANGAFEFPDALPSGSSFTLAIAAQPTSPPQTCQLDRTSGAVVDAEIQVNIECRTNSYVIRGNATGIVGSGLVLSSQPGGHVAISGDGAFEFPTPVASGTHYSIAIVFRPTQPRQSCSIENAEGEVVDANVTNIEVSCITDRYLYVADQVQSRVDAFSINSLTGTLLPIDGTNAATPSAPSDLTVHPNGEFLFASNPDNDSISAFAIDALSGELTPVPGSPFAAGDQPLQITIDRSGTYLYVTNYSSDSISAFAIDAVTGSLTELPSSPFVVGDQPVALIAHPSADVVYATFVGDRRVKSFAVEVGGSLSGPIAESLTHSFPTSIAIDRTERHLYIVDASAYDVAVYDIADPLTSAMSTERYGTRATSERIALHPLLPYAFATTHSVDKSVVAFALAPDTGEPAEIPGSPFESGTEPTDIVVHPAGDFVFVSDLDGDGIRGYRIDKSTGLLTPLPGSPFVLGTRSGAIAIR